MAPKKPPPEPEPEVVAPADDEPKCGTDVWRYLTGEVYEGQFDTFPVEVAEGEAPVPSKKCRHGVGKFTCSDYTYEGEFKQDVIHGSGTFKFASGEEYKGEWVDGKYEGKGTYRFKDGSKYEGEWMNNTMHGKGVYTDSKNKQHSGQYYNGSGPGLEF